ncbi:hypothetical protein NQ318_000191 [Aromia moschata]|uniref:HTH psq-type domain-containing protein n=1 Tax=Aromia moschata TaxID=1265417 RepID=A0AAV8YIH2_9CUCU|nr:hypothetical protein NQ318_000191 [Aromia moschata]
MSGAKERVMQRKEPAKRLTLEQKLDLINLAKNGVKNVDLCKIDDAFNSFNIKTLSTCKQQVDEVACVFQWSYEISQR